MKTIIISCMMFLTGIVIGLHLDQQHSPVQSQIPVVKDVIQNVKINDVFTLDEDDLLPIKNPNGWRVDHYMGGHLGYNKPANVCRGGKLRVISFINTNCLVEYSRPKDGQYTDDLCAATDGTLFIKSPSELINMEESYQRSRLTIEAERRIVKNKIE